MKKKPLQDRLNELLSLWGPQNILAFLKDVEELRALFDVEDGQDWVEDEVGEDVREIRLARCAYLLSRIFDIHGTKIGVTQARYSDVWKEMVKLSKL